MDEEEVRIINKALQQVRKLKIQTVDNGNKYIYFILHSSKPKTQVWIVVNKNYMTCLGLIRWHSPWRQYVYYPASHTMFNSGCLESIVQFMTRLNTEKTIKS